MMKENIPGWLAPDGRFFPCGVNKHDSSATQVLKTTVRELELQGWVRVHKRDYDMYRSFMTAEQRNWLSLRGYYVR